MGSDNENKNDQRPWYDQPWYRMWDYIDDTEKRAMQEIVQAGSERAIVIVAVSVLETRLTDVIQMKLVWDEDVITIFFKADGPIGSFATKVRFAFLLGILSKEQMKEMLWIKEIRNRFAHNPLAKDCSSELILPLIRNLKLFHDRNSSVPGDYLEKFKELAAKNPSGEEFHKAITEYGESVKMPLPGLDVPINHLMTSIMDYYKTFGERIPHDRKFDRPDPKAKPKASPEKS